MRKRTWIALIVVVALAFGTLVACGKDNTDGAAVTGITLSDTELTVAVGGDATLTATISPESAKNTAVTWTVSDSNIATVTPTGASTTVHGVAIGGPVTVTATCGGKTATCSVTVSEPSVVLKEALAATKSIDVGTIVSRVERTTTAKTDATGHTYEKAYSGTHTAAINMETGKVYQQAIGKVTMSDSATQQDANVQYYVEWTDGKSVAYFKGMDEGENAEKWGFYPMDECTKDEFKSDMLEEGLELFYDKYAANTATDESEFKSLDDLTSLFTYANGKYTAQLKYRYVNYNVDLISANVEFTVAGGKIKTAKFEMSGDIHLAVSSEDASTWVSLASYTYTEDITLGESGEITLSNEDTQAINEIKAWRKIFTDTLAAPQLEMTDALGMFGGSFSIDTAGKTAKSGENYYKFDDEGKCWEYEGSESTWTKRPYNVSDMTALAAIITESAEEMLEMFSMCEHTGGANGVYTITLSSSDGPRQTSEGSGAQTLTMTVVDGKITKLESGPVSVVTFAYNATVKLPSAAADAVADLKPTAAQWDDAANELKNATNLTIKINGTNFIELDDVHSTAKKAVSATVTEYYEYTDGAYRYYRESDKWLKGAAQGGDVEDMFWWVLQCEELEWLRRINSMYSSFEYDSAKDAMVAQPAPSTTVTVKFVDFKVSSVKINDTEYTFEYGNTTVTIPQDVKTGAVSDNKLTNQQWYSAFGFMTQERDFSVSGTDDTSVKVSYTNKIAEINGVYYTEESGKLYKYEKTGSTWTKHPENHRTFSGMVYEKIGQLDMMTAFYAVSNSYNEAAFDIERSEYTVNQESTYTVKFDANKKLASIAVTYPETSTPAETYTFAYTGVEVALPDEAANAQVDYKLTLEQWRSIMDLNNYEQLTVTKNGTKIIAFYADKESYTTYVMIMEAGSPTYYEYNERENRVTRYVQINSQWYCVAMDENPDPRHVAKRPIQQVLGVLREDYASFAFDNTDTYTRNAGEYIVGATVVIDNFKLARITYGTDEYVFTYGCDPAVIPTDVPSSATPAQSVDINRESWYETFQSLIGYNSTCAANKLSVSLNGDVIFALDATQDNNQKVYGKAGTNEGYIINDGTNYTHYTKNDAGTWDNVNTDVYGYEQFVRDYFTTVRNVLITAADSYDSVVVVGNTYYSIAYVHDRAGNEVSVLMEITLDGNNRVETIKIGEDTYTFAYDGFTITPPQVTTPSQDSEQTQA